MSDETTVEYETYFAPLKAELEAVFTPAEFKKIEQAFELAGDGRTAACGLIGL